LNTVLICLVLLSLLTASGLITRHVPIPTPFVQIALGAIVGWTAPGLHVEFDPELFMLLFVPPLLFSDGWGMPKRELIRHGRSIFYMAVGLVFFTVLGVGYLIHWLIPEIPLAAAFALGGALSPTDPVALSAMTAKLHLPERTDNILRGEALFNDASGLVSFKFAVAATLTGVFSLSDAALSFLWIGGGGAILGFALARIFAWLLPKAVRHDGGDTSTESLLLVLLPFAVYLISEKVGVSGIMAAVTAGLVANQASYFKHTEANMRIQSRILWGMISFIFNGLIFLLLGFYLPVAYQDAESILGHSISDIGYLGLVAVALTVAMIIIRFFWVSLTLPIWAIFDHWRKRTSYRPGVLPRLLVSVGGVRGAIALAAILSIPMTMTTSEGAVVPFPSRGMLIVLAVGVILSSMLIGTLTIPLILRGIPHLEEDPTVAEQCEARRLAADAAIQAIESKQTELASTLSERDNEIYSQVSESLISYYRRIITSIDGAEEERSQGKLALAINRELQVAAINGARQKLHHLRRHGLINNETFDAIMSGIDIREASLNNELYAYHDRSE
jgi:Na+/H+ antiporter